MMTPQDLMSSYLFKNATKGKATTISPNKLAKFITNPQNNKKAVEQRNGVSPVKANPEEKKNTSKSP